MQCDTEDERQIPDRFCISFKKRKKGRKRNQETMKIWNCAEQIEKEEKRVIVYKRHIVEKA